MTVPVPETRLRAHRVEHEVERAARRLRVFAVVSLSVLLLLTIAMLAVELVLALGAQGETTHATRIAERNLELLQEAQAERQQLAVTADDLRAQIGALEQQLYAAGITPILPTPSAGSSSSSSSSSSPSSPQPRPAPAPSSRPSSHPSPSPSHSPTPSPSPTRVCLPTVGCLPPLGELLALIL